MDCEPCSGVGDSASTNLNVTYLTVLSDGRVGCPCLTARVMLASVGDVGGATLKCRTGLSRCLGDIVRSPFVVMNVTETVLPEILPLVPEDELFGHESCVRLGSLVTALRVRSGDAALVCWCLLS